MPAGVVLAGAVPRLHAECDVVAQLYFGSDRHSVLRHFLVFAGPGRNQPRPDRRRVGPVAGLVRIWKTGRLLNRRSIRKRPSAASVGHRPDSSGPRCLDVVVDDFAIDIADRVSRILYAQKRPGPGSADFFHRADVAVENLWQVGGLFDAIPAVCRRKAAPGP